MISVAEGQAHILAQVVRPVPSEPVPIAQALGRVLAGDITAPFDVPPADNSAVDGYAVRAADLVPGARARFRVVSDLPAGSTYQGSLGPGEALRS
jgi:molybdopterin molybdotransferase